MKTGCPAQGPGRRKLPASVFKRDRKCPWRQQGINLIELVVALAIVAVVMGVGVPSFSSWVLNSQIRTMAESVQNGLQVARAEAVRRNAPVRFQMTDSANASCTVSEQGTNWVISLDDATGKCGNAPSDTTEPRIVQARPASEGAANVVVAADSGLVRFDGLGRVISSIPSGVLNIDVSHARGGDCAAIGGPMRCLRVTVTVGGQVRMCDPALDTLDTTQIRRC
jgi:type IV fimbrial biogenesis protein FimT